MLLKKFLLTWYGITDLKVSLGIDNFSGPVLGALLSDNYSDVVVLGYTNTDKENNTEESIKEQVQNIQKGDLDSLNRLVEKFSNTLTAHNHFIDWLKEKLISQGKDISVYFLPVTLKHLNDTEGIYDAAIESLKTISQIEGDKSVTLHLSPGTPVMAFVWAFAALRFQSLKKRLISSSQANKLENITLPNEWMEWHGRQVYSSKNDFVPRNCSYFALTEL